MIESFITIFFGDTVRKLQRESYVKGFDAGRAGMLAALRNHAEFDPETGNRHVTISRGLWQELFPR